MLHRCGEVDILFCSGLKIVYLSLLLSVILAVVFGRCPSKWRSLPGGFWHGLASVWKMHWFGGQTGDIQVGQETMVTWARIMNRKEGTGFVWCCGKVWSSLRGFVGIVWWEYEKEGVEWYVFSVPVWMQKASQISLMRNPGSAGNVLWHPGRGEGFVRIVYLHSSSRAVSHLSRCIFLGDRAQIYASWPLHLFVPCLVPGLASLSLTLHNGGDADPLPRALCPSRLR